MEQWPVWRGVVSTFGGEVVTEGWGGGSRE